MGYQGKEFSKGIPFMINKVMAAYKPELFLLL